MPGLMGLTTLTNISPEEVTFRENSVLLTGHFELEHETPITISHFYPAALVIFGILEVIPTSLMRLDL